MLFSLFNPGFGGGGGVQTPRPSGCHVCQSRPQKATHTHAGRARLRIGKLNVKSVVVFGLFCFGIVLVCA